MPVLGIVYANWLFSSRGKYTISLLPGFNYDPSRLCSSLVLSATIFQPHLKENLSGANTKSGIQTGS